MKFCKDVVTMGLAGTLIGLHVYMLMSPKKQKEIERGLKKAVTEMKQISDEMFKMVRDFR